MNRNAVLGFIILALGMIPACHQPGPRDISSEDAKYPEWVKLRIRQHQQEPVGTPPREIWKARYAGQVVYYEPPQQFDQMGSLFDERGKLLCHPDGGITGRGDGRCPGFVKDPGNHLALIWRDQRQGE
jgi:hypothetical protein